MYELFVLACLMSNPNQCITLADLKSPHDTHDKCLARAYVIASELHTHMPDYFLKAYKCFDMNEEEGKINT
jgi:hypothetical protein